MKRCMFVSERKRQIGPYNTVRGKTVLQMSQEILVLVSIFVQWWLRTKKA